MGKGKIEPLVGWEKPRPLRGSGGGAGIEGSDGRRLLSTSARDPTVNPARGEGSVTYSSLSTRPFTAAQQANYA